MKPRKNPRAQTLCPDRDKRLHAAGKKYGPKNSGNRPSALRNVKIEAAIFGGFAGWGRIFKCRAFRAWSRGARPPSGAVGCASRLTCRKFHRPAAAFVCEADCPTAAECRGENHAAARVGMTGLGRPVRACCCGAASIFLAAELGTSFDGGWCGLAGWGRKFF